MERVGQVAVSGELASPRYARGAGPHVNEYVLREKEEKRKKQLEHVVSGWVIVNWDRGLVHGRVYGICWDGNWFEKQSLGLWLVL